MTSLTDADLESLLCETESDRVERKTNLSGGSPTAIREAICAFANDLPDHRQPGVVFVGVNDDGAPTGLQVTDQLLRQLADMKTDGNIIPPPSLTVSKRVLRGVATAVVLVEPSDSPPVRFSGRIWIRIGPRRGVAGPQDERILNERRRHRDRPFDAQPVSGATLADLDRRVFEDEYVRLAFAPDIVDANDRSYEQRLAATKMVISADEPVPTVLGLLVLGVRSRDFLPGAYVQFLRVAGTNLGDPIADAREIDGRVTELVGRVDQKLAAHVRTEVDLTSEPIERRRSTYPSAALQQLVRNAVLHRTYEGTNSPVRITWYEDRLEILSPGGPFGVVTEQNFGQPGLTDYRNPSLAEAMKVLGFVQRFGVGIATARQQLEVNRNPEPCFEVSPNHVLVVLRPAL